MLSDTLRLERKLGAGAMGEVWVAHHASLRPTCSQTEIVRRALQKLPKEKLMLTFMIVSGTEPSWSVLSQGTEEVAFIADDC